MGFGSYDESEQENQQIETDFEEDEGLNTAESSHDGEVEYDIGASNDELIDRLQEIKASDDTEAGEPEGA